MRATRSETLRVAGPAGFGNQLVVDERTIAYVSFCGLAELGRDTAIATTGGRFEDAFSRSALHDGTAPTSSVPLGLRQGARGACWWWRCGRARIGSRRRNEHVLLANFGVPQGRLAELSVLPALIAETIVWLVAYS